MRLQAGLDSLAGQLAGGRAGERFDPGEDLAVGGLVGGLLELACQQQGLFEDEGLQRRVGLKGVGAHRDLLAKIPPRYCRCWKTTRTYSCTLGWPFAFRGSRIE